MRLVIDMDEVIVDFITPLINKYNELYLNNLTINDIKEWKLDPDLIKIYKNTPEFFLSLPPLKDAIESLEILKKEHEIIIATNPSNSGNIAQQKIVWIKQNLPEFIDNLCLLSRKDLLQGDIIIDDYINNVAFFNGYGIIVNKPWNTKFLEDNKKTFRANSWQEIIKIIEFLVDKT